MKNKTLLCATISSSMLLSACGSDSNNSSPEEIKFKDVAVIQSVGSGESMIEFSNGINDVASNYNPQTATDYTIVTRGEYFYHIGKFKIDTIQKYHIKDPQLGYYPGKGFSLKTPGDSTSANPYNMAFIDNNTAVITRYGMPKAWVVNLEARNAEDFLIRELDLSRHVTDATENDKDPEMDMVFYNKNRVFITLQNLKGFAATNNSKVVVFDTTTWNEIDTDTAIDGVQAISLDLRNHQSGVMSGNKIYLASLVYGAKNTGGIEVLDVDNYSLKTLTTDHAVNRIVATENGSLFFTEYKGYNSELKRSIDALYKLNSDNSTSLISDDLANGSISALAARNEVIWLGLPGEDNKVTRINAAADFSDPRSIASIQLSSVNTKLKPINIQFLQVKEDSELPKNNPVENKDSSDNN
ncbi:hypothetical protein [Bacterioplanoides sp.]|uniref:hypothetical protein n=1 Tax=Bacterioplanoides sp. TaxID=2066072 RepID=UPI003B5BA987